MRTAGKVRSAGCWVLGDPQSVPSRSPQHAARSTQHFLVLALIAFTMAAPDAFACAVCYGAPGDPMVKGVNNGIWVLLGLVAFVQLGFVAMFWSFWRRAREQRRFRESLHVVDGGAHH